MNKKKQLRNQKRQARRGKIKRERKKKALHLKHTRKPKKKAPFQRVTDMRKVPLRVKIKFYIYLAIRKIRRLGCFIGKHNWKICSGRKGDSMFTCIRCWKASKMKWAEGGSEKHYKEKRKGEMEIANPKNWEKKDNRYFFKGEYVRLSKEEVRRLEVMLGKRKDKRLMKIK